MSSTTVAHRRPSTVEPTGTGSTGAKNQPVLDTHGDEFVVPELGIKEILDAIPKECYQRSALKGFAYLARDVFFLGLFGYLAVSYIHMIPFLSGRIVAWSVYTIVQGLFGTGCWVLAHECGHGAFSDYKWLNDTVGWVVHSSLLVPYHSWRLSHSKHHKATGHMTRDMVFVPYEKQHWLERRGLGRVLEASEDAPLYTIYTLLTQQLFGWIAYLTVNVTGQKYAGRSKFVANHFMPNSPLYDKKDFLDIVISDIGIATALSVLYYSCQRWGYSTVFVMYVIPWFWVNHWLVHITYLQHTDGRIPHYDAANWNFQRGAMATVDRNFGFIGQHIFHDIIETHVLHHFVSRIPFYNGRKGTEAIRKVLGDHYFKDESNFLTSLYRVARECQFVEGDGVKMFRNYNNIGVTPKRIGNRLE
jgi:omega-6 fatty acid desaturase / acyl-lipid omega-6 desaturase (Delta-12 desaturase)